MRKRRHIVEHLPLEERVDSFHANGIESVNSIRERLVPNLWETSESSLPETNSEDSLGKIVARLIEKAYYVRERSKTLGFVLSHAELIKVLLNISQELQVSFSPKTLYLTYFIDPEEADQGIEIDIQTELPIKDSYDRLDTFFRTVWVKYPRNVRRNIRFSICD